MEIKLREIKLFKSDLKYLSSEKQLLTTLNAHSFNLLINNFSFQGSLLNSDIILPDGISIVLAMRFLDGTKLRKIAGADLFAWEMQRLNTAHGSCFFLGSTADTLAAIQARTASEFPNVKVQTYSPPYKKEFTLEENIEILNTINAFKPDVLFIGMTAPKQEIWAYQHKDKLNCGHICCIGAVFDFYAGTVKRAPKWMIKLGLEWLYRLIREPLRLWKRYLIGNAMFIYYIVKEKFSN